MMQITRRKQWNLLWCYKRPCFSVFSAYANFLLPSFCFCVLCCRQTKSLTPLDVFLVLEIFLKLKTWKRKRLLRKKQLFFCLCSTHSRTHVNLMEIFLDVVLPQFHQVLKSIWWKLFSTSFYHSSIKFKSSSQINHQSVISEKEIHSSTQLQKITRSQAQMYISYPCRPRLDLASRSSSGSKLVLVLLRIHQVNKKS
jgi:hypothetical protein